MPDKIVALWNQLRRHLLIEARDEGWEPWVEWYEGILAGDPGYEELEVKKALIPNEIWEAGPKVLNAEIKRLTKEFFGRNIPQAEVMRYNARTEQIEVEPTQITPDDALSNAVSKVKDNLEDLRPRLDENQLTAILPVHAFLDRTVTDRAELPRRVHDDFEQGILGIQDLLEKKEIPDDTDVAMLQRNLENGVIDLRAAFPQIDEMAKARAAAKIKRLSPEDREELQKATDAAAEISEPSLADELREDAQVVTDAPEEPAPEGLPEGAEKTAGYRLGGRLLRILRIGEEVTDKPAKLVKNVGIIGAGIWAILRLLGL